MAPDQILESRRESFPNDPGGLIAHPSPLPGSQDARIGETLVPDHKFKSDQDIVCSVSCQAEINSRKKRSFCPGRRIQCIRHVIHVGRSAGAACGEGDSMFCAGCISEFDQEYNPSWNPIRALFRSFKSAPVPCPDECTRSIAMS